MRVYKHNGEDILEEALKLYVRLYTRNSNQEWNERQVIFQYKFVSYSNKNSILLQSSVGKTTLKINHKYIYIGNY